MVSPMHSNQANLTEFTNWLHFLLQEMEMINFQPLCKLLHERPLDSGTQQQFCSQLVWNINSKDHKSGIKEVMHEPRT